MKHLEIFVGFFCALLMFIAVGINFTNVVARYVFLSPFGWVEEFLVYINIWMVFLGAGIISLRNQHLKMDILRSLVPKMFDRPLDLIIAVVTTYICGLVVWISYSFVTRVYTMGQHSIILDIPMYIPHLAVLAGFSLMTVAALYHLINVIRNGKSYPAIMTSVSDAEPISKKRPQ
ncbi:TRAP transporter small permease [uncultured Sneathiella sp.]|uniref:TRAP transporter small permease n=1 Tax=uncultured Sneathiella sp. TaxID=879315 RepID=UPI0030ED229F|tara:strand:- start:42432 stop:42956 length:525 start_codon:yes stop_codon:yes gene_type:complete